jgi:tetratricopeptide (TPR) repeat protein
MMALAVAWRSPGPPAHAAAQQNSGGSTESKVAALTREARRDFDSGRYSEARTKLRVALKLAPGDPALWTYLGLAEAKLNLTDAAIADFEKARSMGAGDAQVFFNLGLLYRQKGDTRKSAEMYERGLALDPDDPAANQNYGLLLMEEGKFREALGPLGKLKAQNQNDLSVRVALIECYLKGGMKTEGESEIQSFLAVPHVSAEDEVKLAGVLVEDKQPDAAQEVLEHVVGSSPDSADAHARLGALLLNRNQYEAATEQLGRAAQLAPESAPYSMLLAQSLIQWGHYSVAAAFLSAVKEKFQSLPEYHYKLGLAYYGMHRYPAAVNEFERVASAEPKLGPAQFYLGNCYASMGEITKAEAYYRRAIELNPKNGSYPSVLAQVLLKESDNNSDQAIALFERALALDNSDVASKQDLALCYEKKRKYAQAEQLLQEVVRQEPDRLPAHVALARVYYREQKREEGDRERELIARLEAEQQAHQTGAVENSPSPKD